MLADRKDFMMKLRETLEEQLTLSHPVFTELFTHGRNWRLLRTISLEGYQITKFFVPYVEHLYAGCPSELHKRALLTNLFEEETGRLSKTKNHIELMQDFIRALGVSDEERDAYRPSPATEELIHYRLDAVTDPERYHIGAAAVMIASEGQSLETKGGEPRHVMLARAYGLSEQDTLFFSVHQHEDIGHVSEGLSLVADICETPEKQQEALEAVRHTCRLFWRMYESAGERYRAAA